MNPYVDVLGEAHELAVRYLEGILDRSVAPAAEAVAGLGRFDEPLPVREGDPRETLRLLDAAGSGATMATQGGRFFGLVVGGALPASVAAQWLAAAWDQLAFNDTTSPVAIKLEQVAAQWSLDVLGLPPQASVSFVTGTTMAHFTCLAAARAELLRRQGYDLARKGLRGAPPLRALVSAEIHVSVLKVLSLLGFGDNEIERVATDAQGRMIAAALPPLDARTLIIGQIGNVNSGACDPFDEICSMAQAAGAWTHVDGAFGLWSRAHPHHRARSVGVERADSWATDTHKWLNTPWDCGMAICRRPEAVRAVMATDAAYVRLGDTIAPKDLVPEFGRRARGVEVWAALRSLGREGLADLVDRCCRHARRFAQGLQDLGLEVLNEVTLNQVVATAGTAERNAALVAAVQRSGVCWFGPTRWRGRDAFRISVSSWRTTEDDVERSLLAIGQALADLPPVKAGAVSSAG